MANKVASKRWIYSNFSVGSSSNECATKTEILGFELYITNDSSYVSNQLVREEDIYLPAWTYSFSVSNWDKNVGESGGTTSSISISSSKSRLGTTESVGWSIDSSTVPSWITWNSSSMTFTVASNSSTSSRTADIYFEQDESGKRDYARVTQAEATPPADTYVFTITPNTYDTSYSGASFIPRTVSTKNGSEIGYSLTSGETDWVIVTIDSKVAVEMLKNTTSSTRSTTLVFTQNESGKTQSIKITQSGQQDEYILSMWPESNTSGSYSADAQNTNIEVRSLRNGQKHQIGVKSQPLWCTAYISRSDDSGIYYIDLAIQGNSMIISREDTIVFEQEDSGKTTSYTVSQSGSSSQDNKLTITSVTYEEAYLFLPGITPVVGSKAYLKVMLPNTFTWKTSSGLAMNGGTAYAGNICDIYVFENNRYKLVKSFKLKTGKQTVII